MQTEDLDVVLPWPEASQTGLELGLLLSSCRRGAKELGDHPVLMVHFSNGKGP